jgi:hypothetical protein
MIEFEETADSWLRSEWQDVWEVSPAERPGVVAGS